MLESLFIKVARAGPMTYNFMKETPAQVFSSKICKIFKNTYFEEHLRETASKFNFHTTANDLLFEELSQIKFRQSIQP